jgi:hypothetical protein
MLTAKPNSNELAVLQSLPQDEAGPGWGHPIHLGRPALGVRGVQEVKSPWPFPVQIVAGRLVRTPKIRVSTAWQAAEEAPF